jgi:hypothetical protein
VAIDDPTISSLGGAVLPALSHPDRANQMFIDHVHRCHRRSGVGSRLGR